MLARFLLRCLPVFLLAIALSALGYVAAPAKLSTASQLGLLFSVLVLYSAWMIFRDVFRLNLILLLAVACAAGGILGSLLGPMHSATPNIIAAVALVITAFSGRVFGIGFVALSRALWAGSSLYWLGLIVLGRLALGRMLWDLWIGGGFVLFSGLSASWFARLRAEALEAAYVQQAGELYFLALNLWLGARLLTR
jgi:hypothetical protein